MIQDIWKIFRHSLTFWCLAIDRLGRHRGAYLLLLRPSLAPLQDLPTLFHGNSNNSSSGNMRELNQTYADRFDAKDPLRDLRAEFIIPSKADLASKLLRESGMTLFSRSNQAETLIGSFE